MSLRVLHQPLRLRLFEAIVRVGKGAAQRLCHPRRVALAATILLIIAWTVSATALGEAAEPIGAGAAEQPARDVGDAAEESVRAAEAEHPDFPEAKPVPRMQVIPLPDGKASFRFDGRELTCYRFGESLRRPFLYPLVGPEGHCLTRMGHPRDPFGHSHHNSVWIAHQKVAGVDFWADRLPGGAEPGRIVHQRFERFEDGDQSAWLLAVNHWIGGDGRCLLVERRRIEAMAPSESNWLLLIDLQFESPGGATVEIEQNPFGVIGVRMAKTIGVTDGGGRILNSEGQRNEPEVFRKPAKWCDYSGPLTNRLSGGIALFDHPQNPNHPTAFHVRNDGWMGACLTLDQPVQIAPGQPLRLRYGLWMHAGASSKERIDAEWKAFSELPLPSMDSSRKKP